MIRHEYYFKIVGQWEEICSRSLPAAEKTDACLAVLCGFIGRLVRLSADAPNPALRFYTYMLLLRWYVAPGPGCGDAFGQTAIIPAAKLVDGWLRDNTVDRYARRKFNEPV